MTKQPSEISKCSCGAVTIEIKGKSYSMLPATYREKFGVSRVPRVGTKYYSCNYCVNHWGLELCGCGSGKKYNKCKEGFKECGIPMQSIEDEKDRP
jgi:hypothetical protein